MKYIFVTGGVVSGLGKGITAASLGRLLKSRGLKVAAQKLDPYINVDPGTMSPYQHGEVFVTVDGEQIPIAPTGYELETDELGLVYAVKTTVTEEKIEASVALITSEEYVVPDGYELKTDELGNVYGKTEEVTKEDLGPAIISTYKNGKTKKLLLNEN